MKKIVVILVGLLLLGGAGAGGWFYFAAVPEAKAEEPPPQPIFVEFKPLVLPIVGDAKIDQLVTIKLALEVGDDAAAQRVIAWSPRLNDAFMTALYGRLDTQMVMANGMLDVKLIKDRVLQESNRLLGQGVVHDCLVQSVSQREIS